MRYSTVLALLVSCPAFAKLSLSIEPEHPVVVDGSTAAAQVSEAAETNDAAAAQNSEASPAQSNDAKTAQASEDALGAAHFEADLVIKNEDEAPATVVAVTLKAKDGRLQTFALQNTVVAPGETVRAKVDMTNLPKQESHAYEVQARVLGWSGTPEEPKDGVQESLSFVTQ